MSTLNVKDELGEDFISKPNEDAPDENYIIKDLYNMTFGTTNPALSSEDLQNLHNDLANTPTGTPEYTQPNTDQYKNISNLIGTAKEFLSNGLQAGQLDAVLGLLGSQLSNIPGLGDTLSKIGTAIDDNAEIINTISRALEKMSTRIIPIDLTVDGLVKNDIDAIIDSIKNENGDSKELILNLVIALLDIVELSTAFQNYEGKFESFINSKLSDVDADALAGTINLTSLFDTLHSLFTDPKEGNNTKFFEFITGYLSILVGLIKISPEDLDLTNLVDKILQPIEKILKESEQVIADIPQLLNILLDLFENDFKSLGENLNKILGSLNNVDINNSLAAILNVDVKALFIKMKLEIY
ncbi:hypothetical protein FQA39_LY12796 [Lamprigera yunnana]|nr:hypothetical protein FQA39_LY12796 [Lamprigera yunnana]